LQSDSNVKKISSHITKKVGDRLMEIFKNDRPQFEAKWNDLKIFIQYGILTEEKFWEKAEKFTLLKNVDDKCFTIDEYKTLIGENQTDKDGKLVFLYTSDKDGQHAYVEAARAKGYDVLLMDGQLDVHIVSKLEQHIDKSSFVRVDSDVVDNLILKQEKPTLTLSEPEQESLKTLFNGQLPVIEKTEFKVQLENLGETSFPVMVTLNEFMRRMQEIAAMNPGMNFYGEMPTSYSLVVNTDHPLVKKFLTEDAANNEKAKQLIDLALLSNGLLKGEALTNFVKRSVELID